VAEDKTNRLIAKELHMSLSTTKRHLERVISKLGVADRTQAAIKATESRAREEAEAPYP
jgi:DNA-binding NarL/FixJ family response regulator